MKYVSRSSSVRFLGFDRAEESALLADDDDLQVLQLVVETWSTLPITEIAAEQAVLD